MRSALGVRIEALPLCGPFPELLVVGEDLPAKLSLQKTPVRKVESPEDERRTKIFFLD